MVKQKTVRNFFRFLEQKRNEKTPTLIKMIVDQERLTPEDLNVDGDLRLDRFEELDYSDPMLKTITKLPDNLTVNGTLYIPETNITKLPKNLKVRSLVATYAPLKSLPEDIEFLYELPSLYLNNTNVIGIPKSFTKYVFNRISLRSVSSFKFLPDNLEVIDALELFRTGIEKLPNGLKVGSLDIEGTNVSEIPNDIVFDDIGNMTMLKIDKTRIKAIPDTIKKLFSLSAIGSELEYIPNGFTVGSLDVRGTNFTEDSIPYNLKVNYFDCFKTPLSETHSSKEVKKLIESKGGRVNHIHWYPLNETHSSKEVKKLIENKGGKVNFVHWYK